MNHDQIQWASDSTKSNESKMAEKLLRIARSHMCTLKRIDITKNERSEKEEKEEEKNRQQQQQSIHC